MLAPFKVPVPNDKNDWAYIIIGVNLTLARRLRPQLQKKAPAYAGFRNLDFPLIRAGGLSFYSCDF